MDDGEAVSGTTDTSDNLRHPGISRSKIRKRRESNLIILYL